MKPQPPHAHAHAHALAFADPSSPDRALRRALRPALGLSVLLAAIALPGCEEEIDDDPTVMATEERVVDEPDGAAMHDAEASGNPASVARRGAPPPKDDGGDGTVSLAGTNGADMIQVTRLGPDQVRVGEPFTYRLQVENVSDTIAHGVVIRERVPTDLASPRARDRSAEGEGMPDGEQAGGDPQASGDGRPARGQRTTGAPADAAAPRVHRVGTLEPGQTRTIPIQAIAHTEGDMDLCVSVEFDQAMCSTITAVQPELRLERQVTGDSQFVCEDLEVRYVLTNTGTGETDDAVITEDLPEMLSHRGRRQVRLEVSPLAAGETFEETIVLQASGPGSFTGSARATTGELEVHSGESTVRILEPALQVTVDGPGQHYVGWPTTYDVTVTNTSDAPARETVLEIPVLGEFDRLSVSPGRVERDGPRMMLGTIPPGEQRTVSVQFTVEDPRELQMVARASAYCADTAQARATTAFEGVAALLIELVDLRDPVPVGQTTAYELRVKNQGSAEDVDVRLSAQLPEQMQFIGGQGDTSVSADGGTISFGTIDRLPPGEIATWRFEVDATEAGDVRMVVNLESQAHQRSITEQEPTNIFTP